MNAKATDETDFAKSTQQRKWNLRLQLFVLNARGFIVNYRLALSLAINAKVL